MQRKGDSDAVFVRYITKKCRFWVGKNVTFFKYV